MIHKKACGSIVFGENNEVGRNVRPWYEVKNVVFDSVIFEFCDLSQRKYISWVGRHELSFGNGPACNEPSALYWVDFFDDDRECKLPTIVAIDDVLISNVELLQLWVVEWINPKLIVEAVYNTVHLPLKVLLNLSDACQCFFRKERLLRTSQYWSHRLEFTFFSHLKGNIKSKVHIDLCLMANIAKVIACPTTPVISCVASCALKDWPR